MPNENKIDVVFDKTQIPERVRKAKTTVISKIKFAKSSFHTFKIRSLEEKYKQKHDEIQKVYEEFKEGKDLTNDPEQLFEELSKIGARLVAEDSVLKARMEFKAKNKCTPIKFNINNLNSKITAYRKRKALERTTFRTNYAKAGENIEESRKRFIDNMDAGMEAAADNEMKRLEKWQNFVEELPSKEEINNKTVVDDGTDSITPADITDDIEGLAAPEFKKVEAVDEDTKVDSTKDVADDIESLSAPEFKEVDAVGDDIKTDAPDEKISGIVTETEEFRTEMNKQLDSIIAALSKMGTSEKEKTDVINQYGTFMRDSYERFNTILELFINDLNETMVEEAIKEVEPVVAPDSVTYDENKVDDFDLEAELKKTSEEVYNSLLADIEKNKEKNEASDTIETEMVVDKETSESPSILNPEWADEMARKKEEIFIPFNENVSNTVEEPVVEFTEPSLDHIDTTENAVSDPISPTPITTEEKAAVEDRQKDIERLRELYNLRETLISPQTEEPKTNNTGSKK